MLTGMGTSALVISILLERDVLLSKRFWSVKIEFSLISGSEKLLVNKFYFIFF